MEKILISRAAQLTSPNPITLVCTETPEGRTNLAAVSWWMYASFNPRMICFAMQKASYSGEMVRQSKRVFLAMPGAEIADAAFKCGTVSGRDRDKAKEFGIELQAMPDSAIRIPTHTRLAFECALADTREAGDHYLYICDVNNIYADESRQQIFAWEGYASLRPLP